MQSIKSITIPKPCHQNWNRMTPVEQGRHCIQCSKTVTDFTAMTNAEVIGYFSQHGNVCGRFNNYQLAGLNNYLDMQDKARFTWKKLAFAAAVTSLFATANADAQRTVGKVAITQPVYNIKDVPVIDRSTNIIVIGTIIDNNDHLPLPGVTVRATGTPISTITNINGEFMLRVPYTATNIMISFVGYTSMEESIDYFKNRTTPLALQASSMLLGDIKVIHRPFYKRWWYKMKRIF